MKIQLELWNHHLIKSQKLDGEFEIIIKLHFQPGVELGINEKFSNISCFKIASL